MRWSRWIAAFVALGISLLAGVNIALAQEADPPPPSDEACIVCHTGALEGYVTFGDGSRVLAHLPPDLLDASAHGRSGNADAPLKCTACHGDYTFPHEATYQSPRDLRLRWNETCEGCHTVQSDLTSDSTHARARLAGNNNAAVCVDCHGAHNVHNPADSRPEISRTCGQCHSAIFTIYSQSIHGAALLDEGNPDVPTCIDCHGVHNIQDPTTNLFRLRSPLLCANCHANEELMSKYGISTNVFDSYVSDFHGTTVTLFEREDPNAEVNKAVCYDCHGVHDIKAPTDAQSSVLRENLLQTCRKCHPDATADFASAWMGHYAPSPDRYPLVFFVDQFYKFFIPAVVGFMVFVILTDIYRRIRQGLQSRRPEGGES